MKTTQAEPPHSSHSVSPFRRAARETVGRPVLKLMDYAEIDNPPFKGVKGNTKGNNPQSGEAKKKPFGRELCDFRSSGHTSRRLLRRADLLMGRASNALLWDGSPSKGRSYFIRWMKWTGPPLRWEICGRQPSGRRLHH